MPTPAITLVNGVFTEKFISGRRRSATCPGILSLAACLEDAGSEVDFRDYSLFEEGNPWDPQCLASYLHDHAPIVAIGAYAHSLPVVTLATRVLKERRPETRIILGGPGPSEVAEPLLAAFPHIDAVVIGEGEMTLVELTRAMSGKDEYGDVKGIAYRDGDEVRVTAARPRITDLDALPAPAYHLVDPALYFIHYLLSSRGCPYRCAFCDLSPFWGGQVTYRSIESFVEEVEALYREHGVRKIMVADDIFMLKRERVVEFCRSLQRRDLGIQWWCYGRVDLVDDELMAMMRDSGCVSVLFGVESGSNRVLKRLHKAFGIEEAIEVVSRAATHYFPVQATFIWGYPFETMDDFYETLEAQKRLLEQSHRVDTIFMSLAPLPLSELYRTFGDTLAFSPNLITFMQQTDAELPQSVIQVIAQHPRVFPGLYHYDTEHLAEKLHVVRRLRTLVDQVFGRMALDRGFRKLLTEDPSAAARTMFPQATILEQLAAYKAGALMAMHAEANAVGT